MRNLIWAFLALSSLACDHPLTVSGHSSGGGSTNGGNSAASSGTGPLSNGGSASPAGGSVDSGGQGLGGSQLSQSGGTGLLSGGSSSGFSATGGSNAGSGGASSGGRSAGGRNSAGATSGGVSNGGTSVLATGGAATCPPACGPTYETFYDNSKVATLKVYIEGADLAGYAANKWHDLVWSKWKHCPPFDNYVRSRMIYENGSESYELKDVGIRFRGSRQQPVQGFKLDFQKLLGTATGAARRRFGDINRLNILSIEGDNSHLVQCLSYKTLRAFGVQAPLCNHMRVYVNDQFYGLLENVEEPDHGRFLKHHWNTTDGLLVEVAPSADTCGYPDGKGDLEYYGDTFTGTSYTQVYKIERGTTADIERNLFPMLKCADVDTTADDNAFKACIADWLDIEEWLRVTAVESLIPELQSFIGYKRNFYLYFHPDSTSAHGGRFVVYPWDLDTAFHTDKCYPSSCDPFTSVDSFLGARGKRPAIITRLTKVFKAQYCTLMKSFLTDVFKTSLLDEMAQVVEPAINGDPNVTLQAYQTEVSTLRSYIDKHRTDMQTTVNTACQ